MKPLPHPFRSSINTPCVYVISIYIHKRIVLRHLSDLDSTSRVSPLEQLPKESLAADLRRQSTLKGFAQPTGQAKGTTKMDEVNSEAK